MNKKEHCELEEEASYFALCLLIPSKLIQEDLKQEVDLCDNKVVENLCKKYQVTPTMLIARIAMLNKIK